MNNVKKMQTPVISSFLTSLILLGLSITTNAADALSINVNSKASQFVVSLAANPTTGYQWSLVSYDKSFLNLASSVYQRPQTKAIGAGGQMLFTFTLNKGAHYPEKTKMLFKYARSWEANSGTIKEVTINFKKAPS